MQIVSYGVDEENIGAQTSPALAFVSAYQGMYDTTAVPFFGGIHVPTMPAEVYKARPRRARETIEIEKVQCSGPLVKTSSV